MKYDITYHLAPGVMATVDGVSAGQFKELAKILENPDGVINVSSDKTDRIQLIPVRNILVIEAKGIKDNGRKN
jgi:hypothetical protein